jgi:hypothetical protein
MGTGQRKEKLLELVDSLRIRGAKPKSHEHGLQCVTDSCASYGDTSYIQLLSAGMGMRTVTSALSHRWLSFSLCTPNSQRAPKLRLGADVRFV